MGGKIARRPAETASILAPRNARTSAADVWERGLRHRAVENSLVLGALDAEHLAITVLGRAHPGATDYWDGNWIRSTIKVRAGGFTADVSADLRTDELRRLAEGLRFINDNLLGTAVLRSMEDWLDLTIECKPNGSLTLAGEVMDRPGVGNRLAFELHDLDQTHLPAWLSQLAEIERAFPIVGRP